MSTSPCPNFWANVTYLNDDVYAAPSGDTCDEDCAVVFNNWVADAECQDWLEQYVTCSSDAATCTPKPAMTADYTRFRDLCAAIDEDSMLGHIAVLCILSGGLVGTLCYVFNTKARKDEKQRLIEQAEADGVELILEGGRRSPRSPRAGGSGKVAGNASSSFEKSTDSGFFANPSLDVNAGDFDQVQQDTSNLE
eukprot:SAG22_NODE_75_length_22256_cov_45.062960_10_plen_194_part_00